MKVSHDELARAIDVLGIEGYPTTHAVDAAETRALGTGHDDAALRAAARTVRQYLMDIREGSPKLSAAFQEIPWGPGSPTEYMSLDAALRAYSTLEAEEAERLGAPRGPHAAKR